MQLSGKKIIVKDETKSLNDGNKKDILESTQMLKNSKEQLKDLKRYWKTPKTVKEFASQANEVATMVLNDAISMEKARTYSVVARTAAQAITAETARARFLGQEPDLSFEIEE
jgi:hypothetical protein